MKVTVKDYLNVRVGKPSVNAPTYQYLSPGSVIETDGRLYKGDTYEGVDIWVRDLAGNYYWSGGIESLIQSPSIALAPFREENFWWLADFGIGELWSRGLSGKGIKIAVLDSGLSLPHPDLVIEVDQMEDFSKSNSGIADYIGHGTHVAGIVKASNNGFGVKGIAFNSDFYFGKITNDIKGDKIDYLVDGIKWAIDLKVDVISISAGFVNDNTQLRLAIEGAEQNHILVVCAAGNKDGTTGNDVLFPARYNSTLSVGGLTKKLEALNDSININQTNLFAPGEKILSTYLDSKYFELSGSSQAAPYVAGIACLILESRRQSDPDFRATQIKIDLLAKASVSSVGKIIHPINTLL